MKDGDGMTEIPCGFRYKDIFMKCRPRHRRYDDFYIRHPFMDTGRRAKIFAPFDALSGFYELVLSKEIRYVEKTELCEDKENELDRRLRRLKELVGNSNDARERNISVDVTYFTPCTDVLSEAYGGELGQYVTVRGVVQEVDTVFKRLRLSSGDEGAVGEIYIGFDDILILSGRTDEKRP